MNTRQQYQTATNTAELQLIRLMWRPTILIQIIAATILAVVAAFIFVAPSHAATPPDSCFARTGGTITDYYDNESNNVANPVCPRDVDIPTTIGGVAVTVIGDVAFYNNQLTTLTIPSSVTTIGDGAFAYNQLKIVYLEGTPTMGQYVFAVNNLTLQEGGQPSVGPYDLSDAEFVAVYTSDPSNPGGYINELHTEEGFNYDFNADGDTDDFTGGILINPATLTTEHRDATSNDTLADSTTQVGPSLTDYRLDSLLAVNAAPTVDDLTSLYYFSGNEVTTTATTISGYALSDATPSPATLTLAAGTNTHTFLYLSDADDDTTDATDDEESTTDTTDNTSSDTTPNAPDTGVRSMAATIVTAMIVVAGLAAGALTLLRLHKK